jgi:hypothetical protein
VNQAQELAHRYAAVWNETDAEARRQGIAALWLPEGTHYVREREARGYAALEQRIIGSHEKNVRDGGFRFRAVEDAQALRDTITFHWEMVAPDGRIAAVGLEFLVVDEHHRIAVDYQFIVK